LYGIANESSTFTYDNTNQLTAANHTVQTDEAYDYDDNGNREMTGHTVGANNLISTDGVYNYTYDDEGNRLTRTHISSGDKLEYTWDYRNRLTLVTFKNIGNTVTKKVSYEYDARIRPPTPNCPPRLRGCRKISYPLYSMGSPRISACPP
jgi:YD repeat-containing protein